MIQAGQTSGEHSPHGVFELSFAAPPGFQRNVLTVTGTSGNLTITPVHKPPKEIDLALAKAPAFSKPGDGGKPMASYYSVSITSEDGSKEESEMINSGVFAEIQSFVNAVEGQDDGKGEPR